MMSAVVQRVTLNQAARQTGLAKITFERAIDRGELEFQRNELGYRLIDLHSPKALALIERARAYSEARWPIREQTPKLKPDLSAQAMIGFLQEELRQRDAEIERLHRVIADLRRG